MLAVNRCYHVSNKQIAVNRVKIINLVTLSPVWASFAWHRNMALFKHVGLDRALIFYDYSVNNTYNDETESNEDPVPMWNRSKTKHVYDSIGDKNMFVFDHYFMVFITDRLFFLFKL